MLSLLGATHIIIISHQKKKMRTLLFVSILFSLVSHILTSENPIGHEQQCGTPEWAVFALVGLGITQSITGLALLIMCCGACCSRKGYSGF